MTKTMKRLTPALLVVALAASGASSAQASPAGGKHDAVRACMKQKGFTKGSGKASAERRAARKACRQAAGAGRKGDRGHRGHRGGRRA